MTIPNGDSDEFAAVTADNNSIEQAAAPHLPMSTADLQRRTPRRYSIRQEVEDIWDRLYNGDSEFRDLLDINMMVEGSVRDELTVAAKMVRDASEQDSQLRIPMKWVVDPSNPAERKNIGGPGLTKIKQVLNEVLKDWGIGIKQQRNQQQQLESLES